MEKVCIFLLIGLCLVSLRISSFELNLLFFLKVSLPSARKLLDFSIFLLFILMIKELENSREKNITVYALKCVNKTRNVF